jgi:thiaminase (transcriptional activator TenA)
MSFSDDAWARNAPIYQAIIDHPFNAELAAGTLDMDRFRNYMLQDGVYLIAYSRALSVAAARAGNTAHMVAFAESARSAVVVERALHENYFDKFGISPDEVLATEPSPTALGYNNFLMATAYHGPFEVAVAAILPCFWVYWEVGTHINKTVSGNNPFMAWIDTYVDEVYATTVKQAIRIADDIAEDASPAVLGQMHDAFRRGIQLEWLFWDAAYRKEGWPIG